MPTLWMTAERMGPLGWTEAMVRSRPWSGRGAAGQRRSSARRPDVPGYRIGSPLGFGLGGPVWSASASAGSALPLGRRCAVAVLSGGDEVSAEQQRRRLAALVGARHENLAEVLEVVRLRGGCAVVSERVEGPTLAALRLARPPLTLPEVASLLGPLARALAHLHRHGVVHGDVSPANVVLAPGGSAVLVDLVGETTEGGTPGFAAPERSTGPAGPAADVWSLATLALWLVGPDDSEQTRRILAPALASEPHARCSAAALALLAERLGEPRKITLPAPSSLAHGTLRARGALAETRPAARRRGVARGVRQDRGRHRAPRSRHRLGVVALAAVLLVASGGLGAVWISRAPAGQPAPAAAVEAGVPDALPVSDVARAGEHAGRATHQRRELGVHGAAVERLIRDRDRALNNGDGSALLALSVPGSPAAHEDVALAAALRIGYRVEGLRTALHRISVLKATRGEVRVRVVTTQSAHRRIAPDGSVTDVARRAEECAVLVLVPAASLRPKDVAPCPATASQRGGGPPSPER